MKAKVVACIMAPAVGGSGSEVSAGEKTTACSWGGGAGASVVIISSISSTAASVVSETSVTTVDVVTVVSSSPVSSFGIWRCGAGVGAGELGDAVTIAAAMGESVATGGRVGDAVSIFAAAGASEGSVVSEFGGSVGASVHPFPLHFVGEVVDGL